MRITHVVENLNRGGLERVVIDLALAQKAAGHDCRVVCLYEEGLLAGELRAEGIRRRVGKDGRYARAEGMIADRAIHANAESRIDKILGL